MLKIFRKIIIIYLITIFITAIVMGMMTSQMLEQNKEINDLKTENKELIERLYN